MAFEYLINNPLFLIIPLIAGFIIDSLLGDPLWLPHPVRWIGSLIFNLERKFNKGEKRYFKGITVVSLSFISIFLFLYFFEQLLIHHTYIFYIYASVFFFYGIANKNLISEVLKVEEELSKNGIEAGRRQLSTIVGRDTAELSENKIRIASLETLSENLSDGIIAPVFYFAIGGIPLLFAYKTINTFDSIIGYKNERFKKFGWFAAKVDDILNFIPSRITALLMVLISLSTRGFIYIFKFGHKHSSPNAGYPEAALAGILNCRFGGSNKYKGILIEKPYIGINERIIERKDIIKSCLINYFTSLVFILICLIFFYEYLLN